MNLAKLFDMQRELGKVGLFAYKGPDRFNKLVLALLVELGECANEWRGFKFWSKNQEPTASIYRYTNLDGIKVELLENPEGREEDDVFARDFNKPMTVTNPLLEEYVDGLHFVLELGIEIGETNFQPTKLISFTGDITGAFNSIYKLISELNEITLLVSPRHYRVLFNNYLSLGEQLGFTWEQIEQAYMEKNKVNHQRQSEGY